MRRRKIYAAADGAQIGDGRPSLDASPCDGKVQTMWVKRLDFFFFSGQSYHRLCQRQSCADDSHSPDQRKNWTRLLGNTPLKSYKAETEDLSTPTVLLRNGLPRFCSLALLESPFQYERSQEQRNTAMIYTALLSQELCSNENSPLSWKPV